MPAERSSFAANHPASLLELYCTVRPPVDNCSCQVAGCPGSPRLPGPLVLAAHSAARRQPERRS